MKEVQVCGRCPVGEFLAIGVLGFVAPFDVLAIEISDVDWCSGRGGVGQVFDGGLYTLTMVYSSILTVVYSSELLVIVAALVMPIFTYVAKPCFAALKMLMMR